MKTEIPVPEQHQGLETNTESSLELSDEKEAINFFELAGHRLLKVNEWNELAGPPSAKFQLTDHLGKEENRLARVNDHIRIDLPAPAPGSGDGTEWVRVEKIEMNEVMVYMQVRPAPNPLNNKDDIAHFFAAEATSSFVVKREDKKIIAAVYGRNEKPNMEAEGLVDKIRNSAVAAGAIAGFAKLQWKKLVNGIISPDKKK